MDKVVILLQMDTIDEQPIPSILSYITSSSIYDKAIYKVVDEYNDMPSYHKAVENLVWLCNKLLQINSCVVIRIDAVIPGLEQYAIPDAKDVYVPKYYQDEKEDWFY